MKQYTYRLSCQINNAVTNGRLNGSTHEEHYAYYCPTSLDNVYEKAVKRYHPRGSVLMRLRQLNFMKALREI